MPDDPSPAPLDRLDAISSLGEPTRRALYDYVVGAGDWVSRDQAAEAVDLERATAAHHLDRLASDGLLEVEYRRLSDRRGPGAGRPAKLYRRSPIDFDVSLPPRDYELAGNMLAEAADRSRTEVIDITTAIDQVAQTEGTRFAAEIRSHPGRSAGRRAAGRRRALLDVLESHGFEPRSGSDGTIVLNNCPFHHLAQQHTDLICGMNLCLLDTAVNTVNDTGYQARLEPEDGLCCVKLHPSS